MLPYDYKILWAKKAKIIHSEEKPVWKLCLVDKNCDWNSLKYVRYVVSILRQLNFTNLCYDLKRKYTAFYVIIAISEKSLNEVS